MTTFDQKILAQELKIHAKALGIPSGAAETFISCTLKAVENDLQSKSIVTDNDLKRIVYKELKKYHADLAYVYKNRDKII